MYPFWQHYKKQTMSDIEWSDDETEVCTDIQEALQMQIPFGKFKGTTLKEMQTSKRTRGWLQWALKNAESLTLFQTSCIKLVVTDYKAKKLQRIQRLIDEKTNV